MIDFFKDPNNHNKEFKLSEIDSAIRKSYEKSTGLNDIYTVRTMRSWIKSGDDELPGRLERRKRGAYIFIPGEKFVKKKSPFSESIKKLIKKRDNYQCQWCKKKETLLDILAVDHVIPEDAGGKGTYENGITLCTICNNRKKNLKTSSFGFNMFKKYLEISKKNNDKLAVKFLKELLKVYKKYNLS